MAMDDHRTDSRQPGSSDRSSSRGPYAASATAGRSNSDFGRLPLPRERLPLRKAPSSANLIDGLNMHEDVIVRGLSCKSESLAELAKIPVPSESLLRRVFDLTPAEARLAQALACGDSLERVAQVLSVKMTTARTQLAAIFAKTRTNRQAQLVAILSRLAHLNLT